MTTTLRTALKERGAQDTAAVVEREPRVPVVIPDAAHGAATGNHG